MAVGARPLAHKVKQGINELAEPHQNAWFSLGFFNTVPNKVPLTNNQELGWELAESLACSCFD